MGCVQARVSEWSLSTLPSPIPELQHAPLPLKVLWARERASTPPFSVAFYLGSHLSPLRSWECIIHSKYMPSSSLCDRFLIYTFKQVSDQILLIEYMYPTNDICHSHMRVMNSYMMNDIICLKRTFVFWSQTKMWGINIW